MLIAYLSLALSLARTAEAGSPRPSTRTRLFAALLMRRLAKPWKTTPRNRA
jgi:hypothetical protein